MTVLTGTVVAVKRDRSAFEASSAQPSEPSEVATVIDESVLLYSSTNSSVEPDAPRRRNSLMSTCPGATTSGTRGAGGAPVTKFTLVRLDGMSGKVRDAG